MPKPYYTTAEIARMTHVSATTVADWIDSGKLKAYRTGGGHRRGGPQGLRGFFSKSKYSPARHTFFGPSLHINNRRRRGLRGAFEGAPGASQHAGHHRDERV